MNSIIELFDVRKILLWLISIGEYSPVKFPPGKLLLVENSLKHISYISFKELTEFLLSQTQLKSKKVIQVFHIKTKRMHYYSLETLSYLKLKITVSKECLAKDKFILDFIIIGSILLRLLKLKLIFMENNCCIQKMLAFKYKIYVQLIFDNNI